MWRINAVRYYQTLLAFLIFVEVAVILLFGIIMISSNAHLILPKLLSNFLYVAVWVTTLMIANLIGYVVIFQVISNRDDHLYHETYHQWMKLWAQSYFTNALPATVPIKPAVVDAHLDFTKTIPNNEALIRRANEYKIMDFWHQQIRSHNKINVLRALEAIGILGSDEDLDLLFHYTKADNLEISISSTIAIAHLIKRLAPDMIDEALQTFAVVLCKKNLPVFVVEEIYTVLDSDSHQIKSVLLSQETIPDNLLLATIHSISTNYEANYAQALAHHIHHKNPLIKQAILKLFMKLNHIPKAVLRDVLQASMDQDKGVREQALATLIHMPLYQTRLTLWLALGNADWSVRYAAARILKQYGAEGEQVLETASEKHDTPFGKAIAAQVLKSNI